MRSDRPNRVALTVIALVVPGFALAVTPLRGFGELIFVGMIPALIGSMHARRVAAIAAGITAALVAILITAGTQPIAAGVVMALVGLGVGISSLRGWQGVAVVVTSWPSVLLVAPPAPLADHGWFGSFASVVLLATAATALGGAWTLLITAAFLPRPPAGGLEPQPRSAAIVYAASLAVLLGGIAFAVTRWGGGTMAGWVLLTVLVIARPGYAETRRRLVARSLGTVVGGAAAGAVGLLLPVPRLVLALGLICLVAAVILQLKQSNYALYSIALTAAVVLLNASGGRLLDVDAQRVGFTLLGAVLAGVLLLALQLVLTAVVARRSSHDAPA